ncbi:hypothetical protein Q8791_20135 [Nocardiopsis sp. CT-R113]|uniref:Uncharacterized protein n=1 Tax=Nocardiopsis codii TaxID=3065942 RepID=A0ABU7KBC0_9ACTN|nr:hypothetical protein [Nocardiopsis sp. CT-R113]MEE2039535.1 hypothetical protein [Nocardiopsis sp. CT-R113]
MIAPTPSMLSRSYRGGLADLSTGRRDLAHDLHRLAPGLGTLVRATFTTHRPKTEQ